MKKEVAEQWVEALRSGEYQQTRGRMRATDESGARSYCCLGVLCEVLREEITTIAFPSPEIQEMAGMRTKEGHIPSKDFSLSWLNDEGRLSFSEIADVIEKHWEEL